MSALESCLLAIPSDKRTIYEKKESVEISVRRKGLQYGFFEKAAKKEEKEGHTSKRHPSPHSLLLISGTFTDYIERVRRAGLTGQGIGFGYVVWSDGIRRIGCLQDRE